MKKIVITAIISVFTTVIVSSNSKQSIKSITADGTNIAAAIFRKDIGSAD